MTPAEVSSAVMAAAGGAAEAPLACVDAGVYRSPIALRTGRPAAEIARRLSGAPGIGRVEAGADGFLTITVERPEALATSILGQRRTYARRAPIAEGPAWPDRPRTFENPGFAVRYAYARAAATVRRAGELGVPEGGSADLRHPAERALLRALAELPARADQAARQDDPIPLRKHLERLAEAYHDVYERCPALPVGDEKPGAAHGARRTLAEAVCVALANGMHMIGESPRERI
ncbi:anticodon-binding protein [Actinomadura craniellae]|uniref:arginine--tRNA ligase n=1 Tax=Actinomadura craniellae TaxID=2231787 RepID=A0A365H9Q5_9ACTN|nr:DALR anticodon-binding domain-containing protein [Actinomadura craniellae]RAY15742.1 anticodon-binding protein [Actinomadura craniellae]